MGAPDFSPYIWQQLADIQKQLGSLSTSVQHLDQSIQSTKTKVDALGELKNKLIGGFIVLGFVFTGTSALVVWSANKIWDTVSAIAAPAMRDALVQKPPGPPAPQLPPSKP